MPKLDRVLGYTRLADADLQPPTAQGVFFEPADTETGAWVAHDLITGGCGVLDLGSGSGAAAAAMARSGAGHVHGVDGSAASVEWAQRHYASTGDGPRVTFAHGDFARLTSGQLLDTAQEPLPARLVVTSNPPYVPLAESADRRRSIGGGLDGLRCAPAVIGHAVALRGDLGLTVGSYSSPAKAVRMLAAAGFRIETVTLAPLALGEFTARHQDRINALEQAGEAVLWRRAHNPDSYFIVGLACRLGTGSTPGPRPLSAQGLLEILRTAARASTPQLETLDELDGEVWDGTVRVLELPQPSLRNHW